MKSLLFLSLIGLILGVAGTIFLAFSTKITPLYGVRLMGSPPTITEINKKSFISGLFLIALGFLLQAISIVLQIIRS